MAESELDFENPYQLIVAVILSAQCTDKRVNMHTPAFFIRFPNPQMLAQGTFEEVLELIKSISFPNNKAKHLLGMAKMLVEDFGGEVPQEVEQLEKLPGVGRKTANVVASVIYNKPVIAVDPARQVCMYCPQAKMRRVRVEGVVSFSGGVVQVYVPAYVSEKVSAEAAVSNQRKRKMTPMDKLCRLIRLDKVERKNTENCREKENDLGRIYT